MTAIPAFLARVFRIDFNCDFSLLHSKILNLQNQFTPTCIRDRTIQTFFSGLSILKKPPSFFVSCQLASAHQFESMWGIIPSTSQLELDVPVSVHPAPDILGD
ncbi:hypothetical protein [Microcoleus sp. N9_A2]|uniref:hypothetical protein n=1 Tax=Microcoleus sp. N9_A2 TaxID=3055381 RepID=UPI002FD37A98